MIYAIDFDGTLSFGEFPDCGRPNIRLIDWLKEKQKDGDKIILWTCREGEYLSIAVDFCKRYGLVFDAVNENVPELKEKYGNDTRKIGCDYYIDDKHFTSEYLIKKHEKNNEPRCRIAKISR